MPHRIRLRGPWEIEPLWRWERDERGVWQKSQAGSLSGGTFIAPRRWSDVLGDDFRGCVRLSRRFHRPTGLEAESKLWLVVADLAGIVEVRLNEQPIARFGGRDETGDEANRTESAEPVHVEIGRFVEPQNVLTLLVTAPPISADHSRADREASDRPSDWLGQVWLDIESPRG